MLKAGVLVSLIVYANALSGKVKQNVRINFGADRFITLHDDEITDVVYDIIHEHDSFGHSQGHHHIRLSPQAVNSLEEEGVKFEDKTDLFLTEVERNLMQDDFVCEDTAEACAGRPTEEFFNTYHTLETLYKRYENLHNANPESTRWEVLGQSHEGRDQMLLWIGDDGEKPLVYYYCAIHAREWIGPLYCAHLAESLLDPTHEKAQNLLKKYSFVITPIGNPDGYTYTHTVDNFWRKTRKPNADSSCIGTDPNRNWGYEWGGQGASDNPCSETYRGVEPFDQIEIMNLKTFSDEQKHRLIHINDVHSYGEYYLSAWAYTQELPPAEDYAKMKATNDAMFDAIKEFSGLEFKIGPTATTIYPASGGSMDYFYGVNDILYAGSYEARGGGLSGLQGFQPPTSNIKPSNAELFEGTYAFLDKVFEIELCADLSETNIFWSSQPRQELEMASCEDLEPYCGIYDSVSSRCPATCDGCTLEAIDIVAKAVVISENARTNNDDTQLAIVSGLAIIAVVAGIVLAVQLQRKNKIIEQAEKETVHHYDVKV